MKSVISRIFFIVNQSFNLLYVFEDIYGQSFKGLSNNNPKGTYFAVKAVNLFPRTCGIIVNTYH